MNDCTSLISGETLPTWESLRPAIQLAEEQSAAVIRAIIMRPLAHLERQIGCPLSI